MPFYFILCILWHFLSYYVFSCHFRSFYVILCHFILLYESNAILWILYHFMSLFIIVCHFMLFNAFQAVMIYVPFGCFMSFGVFFMAFYAILAFLQIRAFYEFMHFMQFHTFMFFCNFRQFKILEGNNSESKHEKKNLPWNPHGLFQNWLLLSSRPKINGDMNLLQKHCKQI